MFLIVDEFGQTRMTASLVRADHEQWEAGYVTLINVNTLSTRTRDGWKKIPHNVDNTKLRRYYTKILPKRKFIPDPKTTDDGNEY